MSSSDSDLESQSSSTENTQVRKTPRPRRKWTKEEDEKLRLLVSRWGDQGGRRNNWEKVSEGFEHRTSKDCRKRWIRSLDPKLRHGKWNSNEDKILKEAYQRLGPSWQRIAKLIPGRTDDQCAKRYSDVLDPSVQDRLRPWDPVEDEKLLSLYAQHGPRWAFISKELLGRTGLTCRNRWRKLTNPPKPMGRKPKENTNQDISNQTNQQPQPQNPNNNPMMLLNDDGIPFEVPGSSNIAGYPAGADASWILSNGGTADSGPQSRGYQKNYTITVNDSNSVPSNLFNQVHYNITDLHLDKILEHASRHGQQIVIHQHIYNTNRPQTPNEYAADNYDSRATSVGFDDSEGPSDGMQPQVGHPLHHQQHQQPHNPQSHQPPRPQHNPGQLPANVHNNGYIPPYNNHLVEDEIPQVMDYERPVAPQLTPQDHRINTTNGYMKQPGEMIFDTDHPLAVPDLDDESIDFLAFNPS